MSVSVFVREREKEIVSECICVCKRERERDFERHFFSTENIIEKFSAPFLLAEILLDI